MQAFRCRVCDHLVFFDNSVCLTCGSALGFRPDRIDMATLDPATADGSTDGTIDGTIDGIWIDRADGHRVRSCANLNLAACNWLLDVADPETLCESCRLTSVRPSDDDTDALVAFADAETAKRRLLYQLTLLSSRNRKVITGHEAGVITLDLSESDDAHREFVRQQLGEAYRTVLGHLRHEIGHYYWPMMVEQGGRLDEFRELFGDERISYDEARERHYGGDGLGDWQAAHVSQYATMHPWEDWAETFAHYLHIRGGLETADAFGLYADEPSAGAGRDAWSAPEPVDIGPTIERWVALTLALNAMSRSIGQDPMYPFVLSPRVVVKLDFVHRCATALASPPDAPAVAPVV
jgi:hypothetical protein